MQKGCQIGSLSVMKQLNLLARIPLVHDREDRRGDHQSRDGHEGRRQIRGEGNGVPNLVRRRGQGVSL